MSHGRLENHSFAQNAKVPAADKTRVFLTKELELSAGVQNAIIMRLP